MARRKLVVGNWKMNGGYQVNAALLSAIKVGAVALNHCEIAVCVPTPYLGQCREQLVTSPICWGAQDVSAYEVGAFTGEVSASMLADFDCRYVIVGHSERRTHQGESNDLIAKKVMRALAHGLTPIICVGETATEYDLGQSKAVVVYQLDSVLAALSESDLEKIVVAYEPIWAVGTGRNATPQIAQEIHVVLRDRLAAKNASAAPNIRILYGGSMKPGNAKELLSMPDVDGGLIGGAALVAADFLAIAAAAAD